MLLLLELLLYAFPCVSVSADNFKAMVMQLYFAGTDTTSSQLYWAYRIMGVYTDIQERVHQEITQVLGKSPF